MGNLHLLSRLFRFRANNADVIMFTFFHGDLDLLHHLTENMPVMTLVNTVIPALTEESNKMADV